MRKRNDNLVFAAFLFPSCFAFLMVIVVPFILGVGYSFTNWDGVTSNIYFTGLGNYSGIFKDPAFLHSFLITTVYAFLNVVAVNIVAFCLALLVTGKLKLTGIYRAAFFIPNMIGGIVLGYIWQFIFNNIIPSIGDMLGIEAISDLLMLTDSKQALFAIVIVGTWQYAGYVMMIYIAAIQGVDSSLLEAASIDGANYFEKTKAILFPLIAPAFTASTFLTLVNSFKQFDVNFALTLGSPSTMFMGTTVKSTELLALNIYNSAFSYSKYGLGQAKAIIFFVILTAASLVQVYFNKKREVEM